MPTLRGVITVVQEGRFRLAYADGRSKLFVLSSSAPVEPQDLPLLQRAQARVSVRYEEAEDLLAAIAHDLRMEENEGKSR
ncbi:hypothetical protein [Telmatospirillum sp. J64-1]|uniref:hypothetical protein n=1 Tax=Telmatospirillum sp. J64-1 TaxID=2502183 RepID=UPI00115DCAFD|nr:hypothetical protein [Telmatospirillum sp. J64-1]